MEKIWYYTIDGERHGPVTAAELKQLASQGTLKPDDLLWKEGLAEWTPAGKMKGLFAQGEAAPQAEAKPRQEEETKSRPEPPQDDSPKNSSGNLNLSGNKNQRDSGSGKSRSREDDRDDNRRPSRSSRREDDDFDDGLDDPDERRRPNRNSRRDDYDNDYRDRDRRSSRRDDDYRPSRNDNQRDDYDDERPRRSDGKSPALGIVSLICGILSIVMVPVGFFGFCCFIFFFVNILPMIPAAVALICGGLGLSRSHRGMSMAGVITGAIGLILSIGMLILSLVYPAMMMATAPPPAAGGGGWNPPPQNPPIVRPRPGQ